MASHRVAALQAEPVWLDLDKTTDKTIALIEEAARNKAELIAFPETWLPGYPLFLWSLPAYMQAPYVLRYRLNSPGVNAPHIDRIRAAAKRHGMIVVLGLSERDGSSLYITQLVIDAHGNDILHRRKLKPTHVERTLFGESDGSGITVIDTPLGRLGALNCYEHIQPLTKYAMYAQNEQIHVASWPCLTMMGDQPMVSPETLAMVTKVYALEGSAFTLLSCQIMTEASRKLFPGTDGKPFPLYTGGGGVAGVYGPDSGLLTKPLPADMEGIVYADIDLADIEVPKTFVDPAGHYSRPDVTRLVFDKTPRAAMEVIDHSVKQRNAGPEPQADTKSRGPAPSTRRRAERATKVVRAKAPVTQPAKRVAKPAASKTTKRRSD